MKITTLIENESGEDKSLYTEHGLSIYIEIDGKNILFDTGQSGNFIGNAKSLGVDLKALDYVVISHGHYDHSGGFKRLVEEINPNIKLYVGEGFFNEKYSLMESGDYQYVGNSFDKRYLKDKNIETEYVDQNISNITENLMVFTNFKRKKEYENTNQTMYLKDNGKYKKDKFLDEISLGIKTGKGLLVLVGCSHVGIVNILATIKERTKMKIHGLIGGTHLVKEDDDKINEIIEYLDKEGVEVLGACHCTGKQGQTMFSQQMEESFIENNTGHVLKL